MPLLRPSFSAEVESLPSQEFARELAVLQKSGFFKENSIEELFARDLNTVGLDRRSILSKLAALTEGADSDSVRLAAIKTVMQLWMHPGIVTRKESSSQNGNNVTFVINSPNVNMQNVLTPGGMNSNNDNSNES